MASIIKNIKAAFGDVEMAPYTVVVERGGYEERLYPARRWVCVACSGPSRHTLFGTMFRKLFNYISGKNEPNVRIPMTSPVTTHVVPGAGPGQAATYTMGFLVPEQWQDGPPPTADRTIFVEDRPDMTVLTRRFGGYIDDFVVAREARELAEVLRQHGEVGMDYGHYYVVGYDPPFKLFGRRNEIWFLKTKETQAAPEELTNGGVGHDEGETEINLTY